MYVMPQEDLQKEFNTLKRDVANITNITSDLKEITKSIADTVKILDIIIRGRNDSDEPGGLIHSVYKNTEFRKFVYAWLWLLTGAVTTLGLQVLFNIITLGR